MVKLIPQVRRPGAIDHERLNSLINSMADGVLATDGNGKIVLDNGAALNILDVNSTVKGQLVSQVLNLLDKNNQTVDVQTLVKAVKTQETSRDYLLRYPDGSTINLYLSIAPVHLGFGTNMQGYVVLLRDITREKSLEEERDEFISVVSHELRTPITIAEGNLSNALFIAQKAGDTNPAVMEALQQAHDQTTFLASMINDLATLSRAERGKLAVDVEAINVHQMVEELAKNYAPEAKAKGLHLLTDLDRSLELLTSSRLYVREILQNFITNAIKYTQTGSVTIGAKVKPTGVEFFVQDTGIGISKSDKEKVFDKFFRSEDFRTRQNNGTGLGLYVTMKLAKLIHADISMDSELNKGSVFKIFIPNLKAAEPAHTERT
ncbi:MAG: ATP-binding protein [Candidatus Saccharimonadales bacterium]